MTPATAPPATDRAAAPAARSRALVLGAIGAAAVVLVALGAGVMLSFGPQLRTDTAVSHAFYAGDHRPVALSVLLQVVTAPGLSVFRILAFAPVVVVLLRRHATRTAAYVATAVVLVGPLTSLLKELIGRVRPPFQNGGERLSTLSYPSGHSSGIATLVVVALVLAWPLLSPRGRRIWLPVGAAVGVVVGLSRMWLGVHYLTDVLGGWSLGVVWSLGLALAFGALPGGPGALRRGGADAAGALRQRTVLAPDDGSLGPLLRVADDRLGAHAGYGPHSHTAVDVVAVVLDGELRHRWDGDVPLTAGDVAVLRAGSGLEHDEVAGGGGARVLQCYLRSADPGGAPRHEVVRAPAGWVELGRDDARLWVGRAGGAPPPGLRLVVGADAVVVDPRPAGDCTAPDGDDVVLVWQLDRRRPDWAT